MPATAGRRPIARALTMVLAASAALLALPAPGASAAALPNCTMVDPKSKIIPAVGWDQHQCVLATGNQGAAVRALQNALRACNGQSIAVDGVYGPATRQAVIAVQSRAGIARDGVYGPDTAQAMRWRVGSHCYSYLSVVA
ncbi:peptidoglycan-binding domain-containing protein [Streptomyces pratensis]|uniref:peptidoglycan-binding domain-containing protein n=1 Tax=Streptomyces pratensis TaxID=1169025 RepID=UPI0030192BD2